MISTHVAIEHYAPMNEPPQGPCIRVLVSDGQEGPVIGPAREVADMAELAQIVLPLPCMPEHDHSSPSSKYVPMPPVPVTLGAVPSAPLSSAFVWIDLKRPTPEMMLEVLSWLPVHVLTKQTVLSDAGEERLEYFPSHGYTFLTINARPRIGFVPGGIDEPMVTVHCIAFDTAIVTFSADDYAGEERVDYQIAQGSADKKFAAAAAFRAAISTAFGGAAAAASMADDATPPSGVSTIFSSLVSAIALKMLAGVALILIEADQLNELVLQIMPSKVDQDDLLLRIKEMRHKFSKYHIDLLYKERLLKQLLLPTMRQTAICSDLKAVHRYQRSLMHTRSCIEKLRKGRDVVNLSSMSLVSGVAARLIKHCHFMDYLNHVQCRIALVVMPVCVLPGLWTMNVTVPFQASVTTTPFWSIFGITTFLLLAGLVYPIFKYFKYRLPGALVPPID